MTKEDRSNSLPPASPGNPDPSASQDREKFTLRKRERISLKRLFDLLFKEGKSFNTGCLRATFFHSPPAECVTAPLMVAFSAPKRQFPKAVQRNRVKRLLREAWRLNRNSLLDCLKSRNKSLAVFVRYTQKQIADFETVQHDMKQLLRLLAEKSACSS